MKHLWLMCLLPLLLACPLTIRSQEIEAEELTAALGENGSSEDDQGWQEKEFVAGNRLSINEITEDQLHATGLLSEGQIRQFVLYRKWLGPFIDIYELQAIPGWDTATIRRLLPLLRREVSLPEKFSWRKMTGNGHHSLLIRGGMVKLDSADRSTMEGNGLRLFLRYQYRYGNRLRWGWTGEKDAGESLFRKSNAHGFDFNSFHLFYSGRKWLNGIYLGDYTVNLGQGLIQWQNLSLGKSSNAIQTLRQSEPVKPYSSAGEYQYYRGMAIVAALRSWRAVVFVSARSISARLVFDSVSRQTVMSSIDESGYHRKESEWKNENNSRLYSAGMQLQWSNRKIQSDVNIVAHRYRHFFKPERVIDSSGTFTGQYYLNASWSYRYRAGNLICFGETAIDRALKVATIHSLVASLHSSVSASLLVRRISRSYQGFFTGAFTDNGKAEEENGLYAGIEYKPTRKLTIQAFTDVFGKQRVSAMSHRPVLATDQSLLLQIQPDKKTQISFRWRIRNTEGNFYESLAVNGMQQVKKITWRLELKSAQGELVETGIRADGISVLPEREGMLAGWMGLVECKIHPRMSWWRIECRYGIFETDSYESRLYAREADMLYSYSIPAFYGKGERLYCLVRINFDRWMRKGSSLKADAWIKAGLTRGWQESANPLLIMMNRGPLRWDGRMQVIVGF